MIKFLVIIVFVTGIGFVNPLIMFYRNLCILFRAAMFINYLSIQGGVCGGWVLIRGYFSCDKYSICMIRLRAWIIGLIFISLFGRRRGPPESKKVTFLVILNILIMFFRVNNFLGLYFFFEIRLIPTYFLVVYWGGNYERVEASFYLLIYMIFISFPLLVYIMKIYNYNYRLDISLTGILGLNKFMFSLRGWGYLVIFGAFFIKLPIYLFHIWLPKAHVEAPVYGSMLLAAVLLKLGGYGLLRLIWIFGAGCVVYSYPVIRMRLIGAVYVRILCLTQVDIKRLVAYSSVVHINFILAGLFTIVKIGFAGGLIVMFSHGLCSSGLFYIVNIFYIRSLRRLLILNKGLVIRIPSLMFWWFLLCASNFSFPFSLNFIGEIILIIVLLRWDQGCGGLVRVMCFFRGAYSLYLFSSVLHGAGGLRSVGQRRGLFVEHLVCFLHYIPLLLIILNLSIFR